MTKLLVVIGLICILFGGAHSFHIDSKYEFISKNDDVIHIDTQIPNAPHV